jgi:DNA-binding NarL/FixJ family response regulator
MRALLSAIVGLAPNMQAVGEASDGNEAVAAAELRKPEVILLDLAMPHFSGLEALPQLRRVAPEAKIVVLSGFASSLVADEVLALGATSYLEKGATPDTIIATIERALASDAIPIQTASV